MSPPSPPLRCGSGVLIAQSEIASTHPFSFNNNPHEHLKSVTHVLGRKCYLCARTVSDTPLHITVIREDLVATADLLNAGADPNVQGEDGYTPLHYAAASGNVSLITLLLSCGASRVIKNCDNRTPCDLAETIGGPEAVTLLSAENVVHASMPQKVDPEKPCRCVRYEFVAEFQTGGSVGCEEITALESRLRGVFERKDDVNTNERKQGAMIVSVCTFDPPITLMKLFELADCAGMPKPVRAAYRAVGGQEFKDVWPVGARCDLSAK